LEVYIESFQTMYVKLMKAYSLQMHDEANPVQKTVNLKVQH